MIRALLMLLLVACTLLPTGARAAAQAAVGPTISALDDDCCARCPGDDASEEGDCCDAGCTVCCVSAVSGAALPTPALHMLPGVRRGLNTRVVVAPVVGHPLATGPPPTPPPIG